MSYNDGGRQLSRLSSIQQHRPLLGRSVAATGEEGNQDLAQVYHTGNHTLAQTRSRGSQLQKLTLEKECVAEKALPLLPWGRCMKLQLLKKGSLREGGHHAHAG